MILAVRACIPLFATTPRTRQAHRTPEPCYRYAGCDPVNRVDPLGTQEIPPILYDECSPIRTAELTTFDWEGDVFIVKTIVYDVYTLKLCESFENEAVSLMTPCPLSLLPGRRTIVSSKISYG